MNPAFHDINPHAGPPAGHSGYAMPPDDIDVSDASVRCLRSLLETGLPVHPRPYRLLAELCGLREAQVLQLMRQWHAQGLFRRMGLVVRHRALGISANVMLVMDVDDARVDAVGRALAASKGVTLCYRRARRLPHWPYNLFCMIHGRERDAVTQHAQALLAQHGLLQCPHALLFSLHAYKQRGARYAGLGMPEERAPSASAHPPGEHHGT